MVISKQYNELIFAMGAEKDVVAVDISSIYPPKIKELPTVGYHRALSLEGLLAAKPTLIMHNGMRSLGPEHIVKQLLDLKIPMKEFVTKGDDIESTKALMKEMGTYFHTEKSADSSSKKLDVHYQFQFMHKIQALLKQPNLVIIGVVHDLNLAAKFADHIVLINNTKVLANGTPLEVLTKKNIKEAYFLEPIIHQTEMGLQVFFAYCLKLFHSV